MEITGEQLIPLPQQAVWEALNDPEILRQCIPGCESVERVTESEYKMTMVAAVGPVKAKFTGKLTIVDPMPPESYAIAFEGSGGVAGFGKGRAEVGLTQESDTVTVLTYRANATVGGKIAQVGSRLIDGVARKMAESFFERFNQTVAPPAEGGEDGDDTEGGKPARRWGWFGRKSAPEQAD